MLRQGPGDSVYLLLNPGEPNPVEIPILGNDGKDTRGTFAVDDIPDLCPAACDRASVSRPVGPPGRPKRDKRKTKAARKARRNNR